MQKPSRIPSPSRRLVCWAPLIFLVSLPAVSAFAQEVVSASPDITIDLGAGVVPADEEVAVDNQLGIVALDSLGSIPRHADLVGFGLTASGDRLLTFDTSVELDTGLIARPGDVIRYDGSSYSVELDAAAEGVPAGVITDALSISASGLLLSFDTTVDLGGGLVAADEDLVDWDGSTFSVRLDGSLVGIGSELDVDAAQDLGGGSFLVSFDTAGTVAGVTFADEDVLRFDGMTWSVEIDGSTLDPAWEPSDLDAVFVPEPGLASALLAGALLLGLGGLHRRRSVLAACLVTLAAPVAGANDGVIEISQACAVNTGCLTGDTAGFPVLISEGGSYRLTSNLTLAGAGSPSSMISVAASDVVIDLNGFSIRCAGAGGGTCSGSTAGISGSGNNVTIRDGIVTEMPGDGILLSGSGLRGLDVQAMSNGGAGISLGAGTSVLGAGLFGGILVEGSVASGNDGVGIAVGRESLVRGCVARGNGGIGISGTSSSTAPFVLQTLSGFTESVVQLNASPAVSGIVDMGSNLCLDCP